MSNASTNGRDLTKAPGYHVYGRNSDLLATFPAAIDFDVNEYGLLTVFGAGPEILAVFNRTCWASVEKASK